MQDVHANLNHSTANESSAGVSGGSETTPRSLYFAGGVFAIVAVFAYLQGSTRAICCADLDGYYHIRWSQLLWEGARSGNFPPRFEWLPLTMLNPGDYVDHHFLFHILQIPFTWSGDLRFGAKYAATVFATMAVTACYWLILRYRIAYAPLWLVALLASSSGFLYRMNMAKAPSISIVLMVAGIYLLFERRYRWLAPLAFIYVWTYSMFVMLGVAAVIWMGVIGWSERRFNWRPLVWTGVGILAGFVINPYFPQNVSLFVEHVLTKFNASDFSTGVGMEWYPFNTWVFANIAVVASLAMVTGYVAFDPFDRRGSARPLFFLIFSTILLVITFRSRRWIEYWPPFGVLFAAFTLQPIFESPKIVVAGQWQRRLKLGALTCITLALGVALYMTVRTTATDIAGDPSPERYERGMKWIGENVPSDEMIFNADWDDFPKMFYYDTTHRYVSGLDQAYLQDKNPELFKLYEQIRLGKEPNPAPLIRERFNSRHIFIDAQGTQGDFYRNLMHDGKVEKVFIDEDCTVLRINE